MRKKLVASVATEGGYWELPNRDHVIKLYNNGDIVDEILNSSLNKRKGTVRETVSKTRVYSIVRSVYQERKENN